MAEAAALMVVARSLLKKLDSEALESEEQLRKQLKDPIASIIAMLSTRRYGEVSDALYEADNLVDEVATVLAAAGASLACSKVRTSFSLAITGFKLGPQIKRLSKELTQLAEACSDLDSDEAEHAVPLPHVPLQMGSFLLGEKVIDRTADEVAIVDLILEKSGVKEGIPVVAMVGIGGLGKTTLARLAFNDSRVKEHFDLRLWVRDPGSFDLKAILKQIVPARRRSRIDDLNMDQLVGQLRGEIDGKVLLIVLDNVWCEDDSAWSRLMDVLRGGARGSLVLVITRSDEVARVTGCSTYALKGLSDDDSWRLFEKHAFGECTPTEEQVKMTKEIIVKCAGVPLLVRSMGRLLYGRSPEQWQHICSNIKASVRYGPILGLLNVSYQHLHPALKSCLSYCSLFPRDFEFNILEMVSLWMAQGFLDPEDNRDPEDIGEEYFETFLSYGFFQDEARDVYGKILTCRMRDLMYDLTLAVIGDWSTMIPSRGAPNKLRAYLWWSESEVYMNSSTNILRDHELSSSSPDIKIADFKSVRVLDLHAFGLRLPPDSIGELIHLRYLDLSYNESLLKLPNSVTKLYNLQTLKLNFCYELRELPRTLERLVHLRRLEINRCDNLLFMPPGFENLSSLRTLSRYVVGRPHSQCQASSGLKALSNLKHLRGSLMIELSECWTRFIKEASESNLNNKDSLSELVVKWGPTRHTKDKPLQYQRLLEGLQPHPNLQILHIEGYRGEDFPDWAKGHRLVNALPNLVTICIEGCGQCKTLPPFSQLQHLKQLTLRFMDNVQFVESLDQHRPSAQSTLFPSLEELVLYGLYSLEGWWKVEEQGSECHNFLVFPRLRKLRVWGCPKLTYVPLSPHVEGPLVEDIDLQNINKSLLALVIAWITGVETDISASTSSSDSPNSSIMPHGNPADLPLLKIMQIKGCPNLKTLPQLGKSSRIQKLVIERLDTLSSLTEGLQQLTSLQELEVASCKNLEFEGGECENSEPWKFLTSLSHLTLRELPNLITLPEGLKDIPALKFLWISACTNLKALPEWLKGFKSLQHLRLEGCLALTILPLGLKGLSSLMKVDIIECPQLMERCKDGGEDWDKIKHARVLCHKSWRYALMSESESSKKHDKPQRKCGCPCRIYDHLRTHHCECSNRSMCKSCNQKNQ